MATTTLDTPLTAEDVAMCKTFVNELMRDSLEGMNYFQTPAQWQSLPGYTTLVANPMDLQTVLDMLLAGQLSTLR